MAVGCMQFSQRDSPGLSSTRSVGKWRFDCHNSTSSGSSLAAACWSSKPGYAQQGARRPFFMGLDDCGKLFQ
eukprot:3284250-Rhodomonas_salina.1